MFVIVVDVTQQSFGVPLNFNSEDVTDWEQGKGRDLNSDQSFIP